MSQFTLRIVEGPTMDSPREHPSRIVVQWDMETKTFSTHLEVLPPGKESFLTLGHYDLSFYVVGPEFIERVKMHSAGRSLIGGEVAIAPI